MTVAHRRSASCYAAGESLTATARLVAAGDDVVVQRALITVRAPGSTHAGGPYDDLLPDTKSATVKAGSS